MLHKMHTITVHLTFFILVLLQQIPVSAQDKRVQYPFLLSGSYFGVSIGYINYPFSPLHMEPGYHAESVQIPHTGVRIILFGHQINKYLSAQISYMRPVDWVLYKNVNGDRSSHSVWMNVAGLTIKSKLPVKKKFSVYGEGGLGIITRNGFKINEVFVVKDANYATVLTGAGLQYHLNKKWEFMLNMAWSPANKKVQQPSTVFYSGGFNFHMHPIPPEKIEKNLKAGYIFPKNLIQVGYATNVLGYGVNHFVADGAIPIFWGGSVEVEKGLTLHYQRNVFHARKVFSLDWGASIGYWKTRKNKDDFYTISAFPLLRFTFLRTNPADLYFYYSVAGPSFISRNVIDSIETGKRFTFQDLMGMGVFTGRDRTLNAEIKIGHFSNGNIYPVNKGVKIPLTFCFGYTF